MREFGKLGIWNAGVAEKADPLPPTSLWDGAEMAGNGEKKGEKREKGGRINSH